LGACPAVRGTGLPAGPPPIVMGSGMHDPYAGAGVPGLRPASLARLGSTWCCPLSCVEQERGACATRRRGEAGIGLFGFTQKRVSFEGTEARSRKSCY